MRRCLDTTFLSPLVRGEPSATDLLRGWGHRGEETVTTEVNYFEVALGIEATRGRQARDRYAAAWAGVLETVEVLPLTRRATLEAVRRQALLMGRGASSALPDLLAAAIAKVGGCDAIVTRNVRDFERIGLLPVARH